MRIGATASGVVVCPAVSKEESFVPVQILYVQMVPLDDDSSPKVGFAMYDYAEVSIRRAELGEVNTVRSILQEAYGGARKRLTKDPTDLQEGLDKISRSIQMGNVYVAIIGDSVVGTMKVQLQGQVGTISRIAVLERFRNRRVGTFLVEYAENLLTHMGARSVQLEVFSAMDSQAKFYEGIGYKPVERHQGSRANLLVMQKDLYESEQEDEEGDV